jgi:hypothetical protein
MRIFVEKIWGTLRRASMKVSEAFSLRFWIKSLLRFTSVDTGWFLCC